MGDLLVFILIRGVLFLFRRLVRVAALFGGCCFSRSDPSHPDFALTDSLVRVFYYLRADTRIVVFMLSRVVRCSFVFVPVSLLRDGLMQETL